MCVCVHVCMYECECVCKCIYIYIYIYISICVCVYVYVHVCVYECVRFVFQNVWFWLCDEFPNSSDWDDDKIYERMNDLIICLCNCLNQRYLPHYFDSTINLLEGFDIAQLKKQAIKIQSFWKNIAVNLHNNYLVSFINQTRPTSVVRAMGHNQLTIVRPIIGPGFARQMTSSIVRGNGHDQLKSMECVRPIAGYNLVRQIGLGQSVVRANGYGQLKSVKIGKPLKRLN